MNFLKLIYQVLKALYFSLIYGVFNIINERGDRKFFSYLNPFYFKFKKINHGKRIAMLLEAMGPIFIKFGQLLSTRTEPKLGDFPFTAQIVAVHEDYITIVDPGEPGKQLRATRVSRPVVSDEQALA
jgi:hypothetical protein